MNIRTALNNLVVRPYILTSYGAALGLSASLSVTTGELGLDDLSSVYEDIANLYYDWMRDYALGNKSALEMYFGSPTMWAEAWQITDKRTTA